jgi:2-oxoglutarate/2-oxoacid ferredoxin oxidoreductase subunit alpha
VLAPSTVQEMVDEVYEAFDLADEYRTPVMILADGMLGQMMEPVVLPERKGELPAKPWATNGHRDMRPRNIVNSLHLKPEELERTNRERFERYDRIKATEQRAEEYLVDDADIVVVAFGACARIARSAVKQAREAGIRAGLIRPMTLWPFPVDALSKAAETASGFLTVEMNMGQMVDDVRLAVSCAAPVEFFGRTGGIIPTPGEVLEQILVLAGQVSAPVILDDSSISMRAAETAGGDR